MQIRNKVGWVLPWIATVITGLPYNRRLSRMLDQLIVIAEEKKGE